MSLIDGFHGAWLHFRREKSGSVFSAAVCKIQASKCFIESLPLVMKIGVEHGGSVQVIGMASHAQHGAALTIWFDFSSTPQLLWRIFVGFKCPITFTATASSDSCDNSSHFFLLLGGRIAQNN